MVDKNQRVLIVDDEQVICELLSEELGERGYRCTTALNGKTALSRMEKERFDIVLLDIRLPGISGMDVLREIWLDHSDTAVIMITAVNDVDTTVEAMNLGAADYIIKPFDLDKVNTSIQNALEKQKAVESSNQMEAIAAGVEAKLDPFFAYSKVVTQRTIDIARRLNITEEEIQRWAATKKGLYVENERVIKSE